MSNARPTRDELAGEFGEDFVAWCEGLEPIGGLDLPERCWLEAHPGSAGYDDVGTAYLRGREAGTCPCYELPDFFHDHWDVFALCEMFPCPGCFDDSMWRELEEAARLEREGDGDAPDGTGDPGDLDDLPF